MPERISGYDKYIYHLLSCAFGQCVFVPEVINLDILDVVAIRNVHIAIDIACA